MIWIKLGFERMQLAERSDGAVEHKVFGMTLGRDEAIAAHTSHAAVDFGMALIPSERFVFSDLSVLDNMRVSAMGLSGR